MYVCSNCGYTLETLRYPNSFNRDGKQYCGTCGGMLYEEDISNEKLEKLKARHSKWTWRTFLSIEALIWLFVLAIIVGSVASKH
jgi:hypothetical protein